MMFRKCIHDALKTTSISLRPMLGHRAYPNHDDRAIQHFLTTSHPGQPISAEIEHDDQYRSITDESRAHNVVCSALTKITSSTVSEGSSHTEYHL